MLSPCKNNNNISLGAATPAPASPGADRSSSTESSNTIVSVFDPQKPVSAASFFSPFCSSIADPKQKNPFYYRSDPERKVNVSLFPATLETGENVVIKQVVVYENNLSPDKLDNAVKLYKEYDVWRKVHPEYNDLTIFYFQLNPLEQAIQSAWLKKGSLVDYPFSSSEGWMSLSDDVVRGMSGFSQLKDKNEYLENILKNVQGVCRLQMPLCLTLKTALQRLLSRYCYQYQNNEGVLFGTPHFFALFSVYASYRLLSEVNGVHQRFGVHNDIKPSNFLFRDGQFILADAEAAIADPQNKKMIFYQSSDQNEIVCEDSSKNKELSVLLGTAGFIAPEILAATFPTYHHFVLGKQQLGPVRIDAYKRDVFSLGMSLKFLFSYLTFLYRTKHRSLHQMLLQEGFKRRNLFCEEQDSATRHVFPVLNWSEQDDAEHLSVLKKIEDLSASACHLDLYGGMLPIIEAMLCPYVAKRPDLSELLKRLEYLLSQYSPEERQCISSVYENLSMNDGVNLLLSSKRKMPEDNMREKQSPEDWQGISYGVPS